MPINNTGSFNKVQSTSPLQKIADALKMVETVYGIKGAAQKGALLQQQVDLQKQRQDPNSPASQYAQQEAEAGIDFLQNKGQISSERGSALKSLLHGTTDQEFAQNPDGPEQDALSANDLDKNPELSPILNLVKGQQMADAAGAKTKSFAVRNDVNISKDYDHNLQPFVGLQNDISKVESALSTKDKNGNPLITKQQMGDVNAAIARIYSPGHMSDSTVSRTEYESFPALFAGAIQKLSTDPTDIGSRNLIDHIIDQAHHLGNVSNQNALQQVDSLDSGYSALPDPDSQALAARKSQFYRQRFSKKYQTVGSDQGEGGAGDDGESTPAASAGGSAGAGGIHPDTIAQAQMEIQRRQKLKAQQPPAGQNGP